MPNITGSVSYRTGSYVPQPTGAFYGSASTQSNEYPAGGGPYTSTASFNASRSSSIYGKSSTVQPPSIKIRVKTRYK